MNQDLNEFSTLEELQRHNLLETITRLGDPTYPKEEQPMSWHLDRLERAVLDGDMQTVKEYGSGTILFPYQNVVKIFMDSVGQ